MGAIFRGFELPHDLDFPYFRDFSGNVLQFFWINFVHLIFFYSVGWLVGTGFYRYGWKIGVPFFVPLTAFLASLFEMVMGEGSGMVIWPLTWLLDLIGIFGIEVLPFFLSVIIGLAISFGILLFNYYFIRDISIK